jgi:calmodulin
MQRRAISEEELDLSQEEVDLIKEQYSAIDRSTTGFINRYDLRTVLEGCGEQPTEEQMHTVVEQLEEKGIRKYDLQASMLAWSTLKEIVAKAAEEGDIDILNAFVAMGGNPDKTGAVQKKRLVEVIKVIFGLTINIDEMFEEAGLNIENEMSYYEFSCLLEAGGSQRASRICSIFSVASSYA